MSIEERARFDAWRVDPRNQAALDSMHQLWGEVRGLKESGALLRPKARRGPSRALAAAVAAVAIGVGGFFMIEGGMIARSASTGVGEQRAAALPDGSVVDLNVVTRISYQVSARRREVKLQDGEALFFVHKDTAHPFLVRVGDYEVRAVGTAFNVRRRDGVVQVSVLNGVVSVKALSGASSGREVARLGAGQKLSLAEAGPARPLVQAEPVQTIAEWRLRTVTYDDAPVSEVVADLNRFFPRPLAVAGDGLGRRRVTLRLQVEDRQRTVQTLSALLGARVQAGEDADVISAAS
jgi:transmembrane sensor